MAEIANEASESLRCSFSTSPFLPRSGTTYIFFLAGRRQLCENQSTFAKAELPSLLVLFVTRY